MAADVTPAASDADYRRMVDAISDSEVIMVDPAGRILTWNKGAARLKGCRAADALGRHISAFYTKEDRESGLAEKELAEAALSGHFEAEGWRVRQDGRRFWANVIIQPIYGPGGEVTGYVKVTRDITEKAERERLIVRQRDEILALSVPVIEVWDGVLVLPIIGTLDSYRAARTTEGLLQRMAELGTSVVILDISGVPLLDTAAAQNLLQTVGAARLMGAASIVSGVRPETAQSMVQLGVSLSGVHSRRTLRDALRLALTLLDEPGHG